MKKSTHKPPRCFMLCLIVLSWQLTEAQRVQLKSDPHSKARNKMLFLKSVFVRSFSITYWLMLAHHVKTLLMTVFLYTQPLHWQQALHNQCSTLNYATIRSVSLTQVSRG